jgi:hypothetical protein
MKAGKDRKFYVLIVRYIYLYCFSCNLFVLQDLPSFLANTTVGGMTYVEGIYL